jgi:hypothetical protein
VKKIAKKRKFICEMMKDKEKTILDVFAMKIEKKSLSAEPKK